MLYVRDVIVRQFSNANPCPDQDAIIDPGEVYQVRSESDRSINIDKFVLPEVVDSI